jgi:hypothetical protein
MASVLYLARSEACDVSGVCIECGTVSELLLAPRFPHICSRCLFPPAQPDPREMVRALMTTVRRRNRVPA